MNSTPEQVGLSALDSAYGMRTSGDVQGALRTAVAQLQASPGDLQAALLMCRCLVDVDRVGVAGDLLVHLVQGFAARSDLPCAVVAAHLATEAGGYAPNAITDLARMFCRDGSRAGSNSAPPPPLPALFEVSPHLRSLTDATLFEYAERALSADSVLAVPLTNTTPGQSSQVPEPTGAAKVAGLPLFGSLSEDALRWLLGACQIRDVPAGATVVEEGEDGVEAYVVARGLLNVVRGQPPQLLAALGPSAIFGEMALLGATTRAASVVAVEPTTLLVMGRDALDKLSSVEPALGRELGRFCHGRMLSNLMRHSALLSAIDSTSRRDLIARFAVHHYGPGELLIHAGAANRRLALIASGRVEVRSRDQEGDELNIATLGAGDVVGEISLVLRRPASANVMAVHNTVTLELSAHDFQEAIKAHPKLLNELYELALKRDDETRSVLAQQASDVPDGVLL